MISGEDFRVAEGLVESLLEINRLDLVEVLQHEVVVVQQFAQLDREALRIEQVTDAQAATRHLVLVRRTDTAAGGADLAFRARRLAGLVQRHMVGQDQGAGRADAQALAHRHTLLFQLGDFPQQRIGRDHYAIADQALHVVTQDAGRDQVQHGLLTVDDQGMTGIVAALVTHDRSRLIGQQIDDLALALITPLGAQDHDILTHNPLSSSAKHAGRNRR